MMNAEDRKTGEEYNLIKAWRKASDDERETIYWCLRKYGFQMPKKRQVYLNCYQGGELVASKPIKSHW